MKLSIITLLLSLLPTLGSAQQVVPMTLQYAGPAETEVVFTLRPERPGPDLAAYLEVLTSAEGVLSWTRLLDITDEPGKVSWILGFVPLDGIHRDAETGTILFRAVTEPAPVGNE